MLDEKNMIRAFFDEVHPSEAFTERLLDLNQQEQHTPKQLPLRRRWMPAAAAALLILLSFSGLQLLKETKPQPSPAFSDSAAVEDSGSSGTAAVENPTQMPIPGGTGSEYVNAQSLGWEYYLEATEGRTLLHVADPGKDMQCTLDLTDQWTEEGFYEGTGLILGAERHYRLFMQDGLADDCLLLIQ